MKREKIKLNMGRCLTSSTETIIVAAMAHINGNCKSQEDAKKLIKKPSSCKFTLLPRRKMKKNIFFVRINKVEIFLFKGLSIYTKKHLSKIHLFVSF